MHTAMIRTGRAVLLEMQVPVVAHRVGSALWEECAVKTQYDNTSVHMYYKTHL